MAMEMDGITEDLKSLLRKGKLEQHESEGAKIRLQLELHQVAMRIFRQLYQKARPVDEWQDGQGVPANGIIQIQPDYNLERITGALISLPVGTTSASLSLGDRTIPLYSGTATTVQTLINLNGLGLILNENDKRILTIGGTTTTGFYVNLMGYVLERTGHK